MNASNRILLAPLTLLLALTCAPPPLGGQSEAKWNVPRTPDGQPDIQGYWRHEDNPAAHQAFWDIELGSPPGEKTIQPDGAKALPPNVIVDPADARIPYQPWAAAIRDQNRKHAVDPVRLEHIDSYSRCFQRGWPRQANTGGFEIVQTPQFVIMNFGVSRHVIALDGRPHIGPNIKLWTGDSIGHWEGNVLVVDTTNLSETAWYDVAGNFHSNDLHLIEKWDLKNSDTIELAVTNIDPKVYTKPWTFKFTYLRNKQNKALVENTEDSCYDAPLPEFERERRAKRFGEYEIDPPR
jgi:hypothetical protein